MYEVLLGGCWQGRLPGGGGLTSWLQLPPKMSVAITLAAGAPRSALDRSAALLEPERRLGRI